jgi:hypothetical protein
MTEDRPRGGILEGKASEELYDENPESPIRPIRPAKIFKAYLNDNAFLRAFFTSAR